MKRLEIETLPFSSKASICWSFFWRGLVITICSSVCGVLIGGIAGFILGALGISRHAISIVGGLLGLIISIFFIYVLVRWLLSSRLGRFRLVLISASEEI